MDVLSQNTEIRAGDREARSAGQLAPVGNAAARLTVIVPTLNERDNIKPLIERLEAALTGVAWEAIFVDDDSNDGTRDVLHGIARADPRIRCIHRIGRRGLSSACLEGMAASSAPYFAVIDADLQHDESLLPEMLRVLEQGDTELVVGSRYMAGGGTGEWSARRAWMSRFATRLGRLVTRTVLSDPMSGFFMVSRDFYDGAVRRMSGKGFKILLDMVASVDRPVRFVELPYTFRERHAGTSKLDSLAMYEYVLLLYEKLIGWLLPVRFVMFVSVGAIGVVLHLSVLGLMLNGLGVSFAASQTSATVVAMTVNFSLNNVFTYRDKRLAGFSFLRGLTFFYVVCAIGAVANVALASFLFENGIPWWIAGLVGAVIGAVWNYSLSSSFVWSGKSGLAR